MALVSFLRARGGLCSSLRSLSLSRHGRRGHHLLSPRDPLWLPALVLGFLQLQIPLSGVGSGPGDLIRAPQVALTRGQGGGPPSSHFRKLQLSSLPESTPRRGTCAHQLRGMGTKGPDVHRWPVPAAAGFQLPTPSPPAGRAPEEGGCGRCVPVAWLYLRRCARPSGTPIRSWKDVGVHTACPRRGPWDPAAGTGSPMGGLFRAL